MTQIWAKGESFKDDQYIHATQVKQVFYLEEMVRRPPNWKVVEHVNHKKFSNEGVIVVKDDPDVIHFNNSYNLALSTSLNNLDFATLHIDGQSTDVDAPPDIIDVDEDEDIIDDEDALPHDLADSVDEDLVNVVDDDDDVAMSSDVARGHGGDGGGDDRPPSHQARVPENPIWVAGKRAGCIPVRRPGNTFTDLHGPVPIRFEWNDRETLMPFGDHAAHWANYLGELVKELLTYYPSWRQTQFDLKPHMKFERWPKIYTGIQQHLQKIYNGNKSALKAQHWVQNPDMMTGLNDVSHQRRRPANISVTMRKLPFGMIPGTLLGVLKIAKTGQRARSYAGRDPGHLLPFEIRCSATREYPSLIQTFFLVHTVGGVFLRDEDRALYEEMLRLQGQGFNTETGVPYIEDDIMANVRKGKQRGHLPGVGRVSIIMKLFRSGDKMSHMLTQLESQTVFDSGSGSDGVGDDEPGDDEDDGEDEEDDKDDDS
ncbi:hypothetical protein Tco_1505975 [Tanacetum coccineum]